MFYDLKKIAVFFVIVLFFITFVSAEPPYPPNDKTLISAEFDNAIYWYQNGVMYQVLNPETLQLMQPLIGWTNMVEYNPAIFGSIISISIQGPDFVSNGILMKSEIDSAVFLIQNGQRRAYFNEAAFFEYYSDFNDVILVTDNMMNSIPIGSLIYPTGYVPSPVSVCNNGELRCYDFTLRQTCGDYNGDGAFEWGNDFGCVYGCNSGVCNPAPQPQNECTPNTNRCLTSNIRQSCVYSSSDEIYNWGSELTCSYVCSSGSCVPAPEPTCLDNEKNQDETDVDCGGVCGASCTLGESCLDISHNNSDCGVGYCSVGVCKQPVLLVHGIYSDDEIWEDFSTKLIENSFDPYRVGSVLGSEGFVYNDGDISEQGSKVGTAIQKVKLDTGSSSVDVIAHSMGGLATRSHIDSESYSGDIRRFVMMGTPNFGAPLIESQFTWVVDFFKGNSPEYVTNFQLSTALSQMKPSNIQFLHNLNFNYNDKGVQHFTIAGTASFLNILHPAPSDGIVPVGNAKLFEYPCYKTDASHIDFNDLVSFYHDSETIDAVVDLLDKGVTSLSNCGDEQPVLSYDDGKFIEGVKVFGFALPFETLVYTLNYIADIPWGNEVETTPELIVDRVGWDFSSDALLENKIEDSIRATQNDLLQWEDSIIFNNEWEGSTMVMTLKSPSGQVLDFEVADNEENVNLVITEITNTYIIGSPEEGEWEVTIEAVEVPDEGEPFTLSLLESSSIILLPVEIDESLVGDEISVKVALLNNFIPIGDASTNAKILKDGIIISEINLFDDGLHGDLGNGDGIYGNSFLPLEKGEYSVIIKANGENYDRDVSLSFFVKQQPIIQCWEGNNGFIGRNTYQMRKFCSCAEGEYNVRSYAYEYDINGLVTKYVDSDENENWVTETVSEYIKIKSLMCGDLNWYDVGQDYFIEGEVIVSEPECNTDFDCDNGLYCDGVEDCSGGICISGSVVDCSANDLGEINSCNEGRWDYFEGFTSICDEVIDSCSVGVTNIYQICSIDQCNAECGSNADCSATECDGLDRCVGSDYYDFSDVSNSCEILGCGCSQNSCKAPVIYANDERCVVEQCTDVDSDGFCDEDNDCDDENPEVNPSGLEICDEIDNDCDLEIDEGLICEVSEEESELCWSGENRYLDRSVYQFRKFCKCASGEFGYSSYSSVRERGVSYETYEYIDSADNVNWEIAFEGVHNSAVDSVLCTNEFWYETYSNYFSK